MFSFKRSALAALALLAACATGPTALKQDQAALFAQYAADVAAAETRIRAATLSADERAVVEAELAFAAMARAEGNQKAFAAFAAPDGLIFVNRSEIAQGPAAIAKLYEGDTDDLRWAPVQTAVRGDLGTTWGIWALSTKDEAGAPLALRGRFVTVWRKQADGAWRYWLDMGNQGPPPATPPPPAP